MYITTYYLTTYYVVLKTCTIQNTVISFNISEWKLVKTDSCPKILGWIIQISAEIARFHKIATPGNSINLRYFIQWNYQKELRKQNYFMVKYLLYHGTIIPASVCRFKLRVWYPALLVYHPSVLIEQFSRLIAYWDLMFHLHCTKNEVSH